MSVQTDKLSASAPDRLITASRESPQEDALERALRPKKLAEYVGQQKIRGQLEIFMRCKAQADEEFAQFR